MYYWCSEKKGADQLRGYCEADLRLCFRMCEKPVFIRRGSYYFHAQLIQIAHKYQNSQTQRIFQALVIKTSYLSCSLMLKCHLNIKNRINFMLGLVEHEKSFITSEPGLAIRLVSNRIFEAIEREFNMSSMQQVMSPITINS